MSLITPKKVDPNYDPDEFVYVACGIDLQDDFRAKGVYVYLNHQGKLMRLRSGKSSWGGPGAAKNAMNNHLMGRSNPYNHESLGLTDEQLEDKMKKRFRDVSDYRQFLEDKKIITLVDLTKHIGNDSKTKKA